MGDAGSASDDLDIMPLGAGSEVGRSCVLLSFKGATVMLDCGVHPAFSGHAALPYFDDVDLADVDLLLVTHFHLDHCGAVPYITEKTTFSGRVFMTHATKAIYKIILNDYVRVTRAEEKLFDEADLARSMEKIELVDYHQAVTHKGVTFTALNAGHVLGAAMFSVEVAGVRTLYTGDFSCHEDRHLRGAEMPADPPHVLIVESTYGVQKLGPAAEREARFTAFVHDVVKRGGKCLIPVFALGRAQELLLILDEYWEAHPELHSVPVYYASSLAKRCMRVYLAYINMMNDHIRRQHEISNPWKFKFVKELKGSENLREGAMVVMASPGMLQSGLSRELFEVWCPDPMNGLLMPGYTVQGTLGHHVMSEPKEITTQAGETVPVKLDIKYISFSAHSDYEQTSGFIRATKPRHVVLVHGAEEEMRRLRAALLRAFPKDGLGQDRLEVFMPKNLQTVKIQFHAHQVARALGSVAASTAGAEATGGDGGDAVTGLLVRRDFGYVLLADADLAGHTDLQTVAVVQRPMLPYHGDSAALREALEQLFDVAEATVRADDAPMGPSEEAHESEMRVSVAGAVTLVASPRDCVVHLEWESSAAHDLVADAVASVVLRLESEALIARQCAAPQPLEAPPGTVGVATAGETGPGQADVKPQVNDVKVEPGSGREGHAEHGDAAPLAKRPRPA